MPDNIHPTPPAAAQPPETSQMGAGPTPTQATHNVYKDPPWKITEPLMDLTEDNYVKCKATFCEILLMHDMEDLPSPAFQIPANASPEQVKFYRKASASCRQLMNNSIPDSINNQLPPTLFTEQPAVILEQLHKLLQGATATDHAILEQEAKPLTLEAGMDIKEYITKHRSMRAKMVNALFPHITEEVTTLRFILEGLRPNPQFSDAIRHFKIAGIPSTVILMHRRLQDIEEENKRTDPATTSQPHGGAPSETPPKDRGTCNQRYPRRRSRGRGRFNLPNNTMSQLSNLAALGNLLSQVRTNNPDQTNPSATRRRQPRNTRANRTQTTGDTDNEGPTLDVGAQRQLGFDISKNEDADGTYALDSCAHPSHINHSTPDMQPLSHPIVTHTATSKSTDATHQGTVQVRTDKGFLLRLPAVIHPHVRPNLLSVQSTAQKYGHVIFSARKAYILDTKAHPFKLVGTANFREGEYILNLPRVFGKAARTMPSRSKTTIKPPKTPLPSKTPPPKTLNRNGAIPTAAAPRKTPPLLKQQQRLSSIPPPNNLPPLSKKDAAFHFWHLIFNHIHPRTLQQMAIQQLLPLPAILKGRPPKLTCSGCAHGKLRPTPHQRTTHNYVIGIALSSDICGPISPKSTHENSYFMTVLDTKSRYALLYFLPNRKNILAHIQTTIQLVKRLHGHTPSVFTTDNAKEYLSKAAKQTYSNHGIISKPTTPYSPQENGIAERINATLVGAARAALHHSQLPDTFWEDAVRDAAYKYNLSRHSSTGELPFTLWFGHPPSISHLFRFGLLGSVPMLAPKSKLQPRSFPARYMYAENTTHVIVLNTATGSYHRIRAKDFQLYYHQQDPVRTMQSTARRCHIPHPDPVQVTPSTPPPASRKQAHRYPDTEEWATAHNAELDKLDDIHAIKWIPNDQIPPNVKLIPLTMTYRYKRNMDGTIHERKARCSIRGDLMIPNTHFNPEHTASHMADKTTVRLLLALKATMKLQADNFDIASAYLHEPFKHTHPVYVRQYPRFDGELKHSCKAGLLLNNLYGNPSGGYYYWEGAQELLIKLGYTQSQQDQCLFYRLIGNNKFIFIALSIDDFLVVATSTQLITTLYEQLATKYKVKRLGLPTKYLGWDITHYANGDVHISQAQYIESALNNMRITTANTKDTPYVKGMEVHAQTDSDKYCDRRGEIYRSVLGELRYVADCTRADIIFIVNKLSAALHKPTIRHWNHLKRLLRYLKATKYYGILYKSNTSGDTTPCVSKQLLRSYADADFAGDNNDRKSTSGGVHLINGSPIEWSSCKQSMQALSTCEAEYISATHAVQTTQWLRRLLSELKLLPPSATPFHMDNEAAIAVAKNTAPNKNRKFIALRHHFLREHSKRGTIQINQVPSNKMLADMFTKVLLPDQFLRLRNALHIVPRKENKSAPIN